MNEYLLQYIWNEGLFLSDTLETTNGQTIEVLNRGKWNLNAGPDFFNGQIKVNDLLLVGNIEIHLKASDWYQHGHQHDTKYDNVILHVVFDANRQVYTTKQEPIVTVNISKYISESVISRAKTLVDQQDLKICGHQFLSWKKINQLSFLDDKMSQRLHRKVEELNQLKTKNKSSWYQLFLLCLFGGFGLPANANAMRYLASLIDPNVLFKLKSNHNQMLAYVFGMANRLQEVDDYSCYIKREFDFLQTKYSIDYMVDFPTWNNSRMRIHSSIDKRLGELVLWLYVNDDWLGKWVKEPTLRNWKNMFAEGISGYWQNHYTWGKPLKLENRWSDSFIERLFINVAIPFSLFYSNWKTLPIIETELIQMKPEKNKILDGWKESGIKINNAWDAQAFLELSKIHCSEKKCLSCRIGRNILKDESISYHSATKARDSSIRSLSMVGGEIGD